MIPLRSGGPTNQSASTSLGGLQLLNNSCGTNGGLDSASSSNAGPINFNPQQMCVPQQAKKSVNGSSKQQQRSGGAATSQGIAISSQNAVHMIQTAKIPQHYLNSNFNQFAFQQTKMHIPQMNSALAAPLSMNANNSSVNPHNIVGSNDKNNLSASQKKRISLKKLEEEYCKTIEQICSPNSSTLNLENMKKTQSLHYMRAGSGASSPQQVKSRTSIGKYSQQQNQIQNQVPNSIYNSNYPNTSGGGSQQRNSQVSKSQIGGAAPLALMAAATNSSAAGQQSIPINGALGTGTRSRSKTTNRKKRNLYTSIGNYYQSQQPSAAVGQGATNNSASRVTKRMHQQQNFLDNLEQTNHLIGGNLGVAHHALLQGADMDAILQKKRNKSSTKSYNNKELLSGGAIDHNNSSEICYSSHLTKKNPMTNNFFDVSQFSSNHNSIAKNFENSFQFSAGNFFPANSNKYHQNTSLSAVSANKQRPSSSQKSTLMQAAAALNGSKQSAVKKKASGGTGLMRKSINGSSVAQPNQFNTGVNVSNVMNQSANYGHQNAYDFLSNASLGINSNKAARKPKGGNSVIDSRCSQTKEHANALSGLAKSQVASNTAFGHQQPLNNTSHTTITSNRKQGNHVEIVSGKKNSLQQQQIMQQNYFSVAAGNVGTSDILTAGEISSDRQTLKMNDFLKQIEAYSNDKLDKFIPSLSSNPNAGSANNSGQPNIAYSLQQQTKVAEHIKNIIDREMSLIQAARASSSKQRYHVDESRGRESSEKQQHEMADDEENEGDATICGNDHQPDYGHLINVMSDCFNSLIATFYQNTSTSIVGVSLARVKESYEEIINLVVESFSTQIESLNGEIEQFTIENQELRVRNEQLEKKVDSQDKNNQQVTSFAKQNEVLVEELNRVYEENKMLKRDQKDRDVQLVESRKMIEKLSTSQKQLISNGQNMHHNSSGSSKIPNRQYPEMNNQSSKTSVPPLDLGKLKMGVPQQAVGVQPLISNDSLQTLDKALLNANLLDPSISSSVMNTIPHHDGRILEELYNENGGRHINNGVEEAFVVNQSEISYHNSQDDGVHDYSEADAMYMNGGPINSGILNQSGILSQIAQDKSPMQNQKPFIPPLNLNGLNNRTQAARQVQSQIVSQGSSQQMPQQQQQIMKPSQQKVPQPKFKLDLTSVAPPAQYSMQPPAGFEPPQVNNKKPDQDQTCFNQGQNKVPNMAISKPSGAPGGGGMGLNLANLKQQKGITDFQDEFMAKQDEFSQSWRDALKRERRF